MSASHWKKKKHITIKQTIVSIILYVYIKTLVVCTQEININIRGSLYRLFYIST